MVLNPSNYFCRRLRTNIGKDAEDFFEGLLLMQKLAGYYNIHCHEEVDDNPRRGEIWRA
jgi:hypothetical protein